MTKVSEMMVSNPIVAIVPGSRSEVLTMMVKHNLTGMPVVRASDGRLAGIISRKDIYNNPAEDQLSLLMKKDVLVIGPDAEVEEAARILVDNNIHRLPVVDDGMLVGIITPTDLLKEVKNRGLAIPVEKLIRKTCVPLWEGDPLKYVQTVFRISKMNALPVLNSNGDITGLITDRDLFNKTLIKDKVAKSEIGIGPDEDEWSWEGLKNVMPLFYEVSKVELPDALVRDLMVKDPVTLFKKSPVSEAAALMKRNDFGQLPIRDNRDQLLGMIYDLDVINALLMD